MSKVEKYICPVADLLAYSMKRNHFHLTIHTHEASDEIGTSQAFRKLFQPYALAFTKEQGRYGTLFQTPSKRALIDRDEFLRHLIWYQHWNPEHHRPIADYREWPNTSYPSLRCETSSFLARDAVTDLFGGIQGFVAYHEEALDVCGPGVAR